MSTLVCAWYLFEDDVSFEEVRDKTLGIMEVVTKGEIVPEIEFYPNYARKKGVYCMRVVMDVFDKEDAVIFMHAIEAGLEESYEFDSDGWSIVGKERVYDDLSMEEVSEALWLYEPGYKEFWEERVLPVLIGGVWDGGSSLVA